MITKKKQILTCYICTCAATIRHQAAGAVISKYPEIVSLRQQLGKTSVFSVHYGSWLVFCDDSQFCGLCIWSAKWGVCTGEGPGWGCCSSCICWITV